MKKVAVIFGSRSAEHDVSIITAYLAIIEPLKLSGRFQPIPVYIAKDGLWYSDKAMSDVAFFTDKGFNAGLARLKPIALGMENGLQLIQKRGRGKRMKIDVVFPATHGTYGEDGSLMGLLRMAKVPFVGCDMQASAVAMDKGLTKTVIKAAGLKSNAYELFDSREYSQDKAGVDKKLSRLNFPLFVKPTHLGSSIAISKVINQVELKNAIELALHYDSAVIVEEAVPNLIEVTVPVMGNDKPRVAMVEEALNKGADFFDFQTKYMQGGKKGKSAGVGAKGGGEAYSRIPAKLSAELYKECEATALAAYRAIGASGIARIDLLINSNTQDVFVNEINPLPGSLYVHNWRQAGVSNLELVTQLIELAEDKFKQDSSYETIFKTNFLSQF